MAITSKEYFKKLSKEEKDQIRRTYRSTCFEEYCYSIRLFILQSILGGIATFGLIIMFIDKMLGCLIFTTSFIFVGITTYFLNLSNKPFYDFIEKKRIK